MIVRAKRSINVAYIIFCYFLYLHLRSHFITNWITFIVISFLWFSHYVTEYISVLYYFLLISLYCVASAASLKFPRLCSKPFIYFFIMLYIFWHLFLFFSLVSLVINILISIFIIDFMLVSHFICNERHGETVAAWHYLDILHWALFTFALFD